MLESIDLKRKVSKEEFKAVKDKLDRKLAALQQQAAHRHIPVIVVFEGWNAAGKGTLINELILPLDPRGFMVQSTQPPNEEEAMRPFLWRFWIHTPARGRMTLYDRSWYRRVLNERVEQDLTTEEVSRATQDILSFERQLADDGNVIIKFFLHISKSEQKRRFDKLRRNPATAWRVTADDLKRHQQYKRYQAAVEDVLARTDSDFTPWTVVESHDHRFATLKIFNAVIAALGTRVAALRSRRRGNPIRTRDLPAISSSSSLQTVDLSVAIDREEYKDKLKKSQDRLRNLEHEMYVRRMPLIVVYEGWDAAGKGGNIRRLTETLDPRGYEVVPIAAPNDLEKSHHYLWRFWMQMPKAGHLVIFDRSWYGRVLVERVEGLCSEPEWRRAYREINEMEQHLTNFGTVLLKFWLHIDPEEQLHRFKERETLPHKRWKITPEDWRNREKWKLYETATEEMLLRTSTPYAPWTVVESNCKWFARIKVLDTVIAALEQRIQ